MSNSPANVVPPGYKPVRTAPFVYFDFVPTYGTLGGAVLIELAARTLAPLQNGAVASQTVEVARLRFTPDAARLLRNALDEALKLVEHPQSQPASVGKLN